MRQLPDVGDLLTISSLENTSELDSWVAQVSSVRGRRIELSLAPTNFKRSNTCVEASFVRANGLYRFKGRIKTAPGPAGLLLTLLSDVERLQRRGDYRIPLSVPTRLWRQWGGAALGAQIVDLSAGGALVASPVSLAPGGTVWLDVPSGRDGTPAYTAAVVVDCVADGGTGPSRRRDTYAARLSFDNGGSVRLTESEREAIVRYVFEQQRVMLRVRKLMQGGVALKDGPPAQKKRARILAGLLAWLRAHPCGWNSDKEDMRC